MNNNNNKKIIRKSDTRNSDNRSRDSRDSRDSHNNRSGENSRRDNRDSRDNSYSRSRDNNRNGNFRNRDNGDNRSREDSRKGGNRSYRGDDNRDSRNSYNQNRDNRNSDSRNSDSRKHNYKNDDNRSQDKRIGDSRNSDNRNRNYKNDENRTSGGYNKNRRNDNANRGGDFRSRDSRDNPNRGGSFRNRDNNDNSSRGDKSGGDFRNRDSRDNRNRDDRNMNRDSRNSYNQNRDNRNSDNRNSDSRKRNYKNDDNQKRNYNGKKNKNHNSIDDNIKNDNLINNLIDNNDSDITISYNTDIDNNDELNSIHASNRKKKSIINMSFAEVKTLCVELGYPEFHASQILDFIYKRNVLSFDDISPLPKAFREKLNEGYYIHNCSIKSVMTDETNTKKMLISLYDNKEIEAVILNKDERITFCLSSQVGCAYGCKFCATGTMGFKRNLSSEEILAQFLLLRHEAKSVNSIVFMGMGEPLANAKNVFAAIREINNYKGFNLGIRHITISTVGEVGGIKSLIERDLDVRLAISLHSLKDDVRSSIMPINKKYPLKRLLPMLKRYSGSGKRIITFEWVLIDGINDTVNDAYRLVNLKRELPFKVNLIALNPVAGSAFKPSSKDNMKRFAKILTDNGITVIQRFKQGQKILAGCGQLAIKTSRMLDH